MKLNFSKVNLQSVNFFVEGINFPVAIASYSEWEEVQINYLQKQIQVGKFTTENLCTWCIRHQIQFRILYPIKKSTLLKNPYKTFKFLQLKWKLCRI